MQKLTETASKPWFPITSKKKTSGWCYFAHGSTIIGLFWQISQKENELKVVLYFKQSIAYFSQWKKIQYM